MKEMQIVCLQAKNKADHLQEVCHLQSGELQLLRQLIKQYSEVLKPCFLQLQGHGYETESLMSSYQGLIEHVQGIRSVIWDDEATSTDSGISCSMAASEQEPEEDSLNNTYVLRRYSLHSSDQREPSPLPSTSYA